jgi:heme exporter protein C
MPGSLFDASLWGSLIAAAVAVVASMLFLRTRNFFYDSLALAVTEAGLLLLAAGIVAGAVAGRLALGIWWTWDARLTAGLIGFLLYVPYLMLRNAIEEPSRRATSAAIVSIFAFFDVPLIGVAVNWWLAPRSTSAHGLAPAEWWEVVMVLALGTALSWVRLRLEQARRARDAERRTEQEI